MARVTQEELGGAGSFNPVLRDYFKCPVCESTKFVELVPYGGLWCDRCNAQIEIQSTCDGPNKVSVHVNTKHCHEGEWIANLIANSIHGGKAFDYAWTVIWEYDTEIRWLKSKDGGIVFWRTKMAKIVIHIEDNYTSDYWETLEDVLKEILESEGLHGHIEDGFTGNSTRFDGESHRAVIAVSFLEDNGEREDSREGGESVTPSRIQRSLQQG